MLDITHYWYQRTLHPITFLLLPFTWLFSFIVSVRRFFYRHRKHHSQTIPVVIVGNITVGGTGKTPFVIWLTQFLKSQGFQPGVISRGVGGKKHHAPHLVNVTDTPDQVGDEALLLAKRTFVPVVVGVNRVAALHHLIQKTPCDIVISDDGLQHYLLNRDVEIAMVDGQRRFGNGYLLPAGPLREPIERLNTVDYVVVNGGDEQLQDEFIMMLMTDELVSLYAEQNKIKITQFPFKKIHAVAAIGHPERFFTLLKQAGFEIIPHVFPDHYLYRANDFNFADHHPIIMTEKDAVKCKAFADERYWYLPVTAQLNAKFETQFKQRLKSIKKKDEQR